MLLTVVASPCQAASVISDAKITDRIYMDIKGVAALDQQQQQQQSPQRIVIGLFGNDAPEAVKMLKSLVTQGGLAADCKPKEIRTLQKEQLEANKVYNSCVEGQEGQGVNYDLSTIWRVKQGERIDVGAVSGRFVARQFPTWVGDNNLKHSAPGVVSVRKGNDSGFGFTIYPGNGGDGDDASYLDANHLVVGRVVEGMNVVESINRVPVVTSKFASQAELPAAPSRACRYGGNQLYCSEYKPLTKLSIVSTGVL
jgi:cyclophilin family peptidyl-prolyl cis-trans isomerase